MRSDCYLACYDPSTVIAVIRREADIAIDPYYSFQPDGYIQLGGGGPRDVIAGLVRRQRERVNLEITNTDTVITNTTPWQPGQPFADLAPRATPRQEAFDFGDEALPGYSWPPPRWTGWMRQR